MKDLNFIKLAVVYAGCFLGAGYVSGQELLQYFGDFGLMGYVGLAGAMLLFFLLGLLIMSLTEKTGIYEAEKLAVPWEIKPLRVCFSALEMLLMFAIAAIMNAGAGALAEQLFSIPHAAAGAVFAGVVLLCALAGLSSLVSVFSLSVPCLALASVLTAAATLARGGVPALETQSANGLLGNWFVSAMNFACYNFFATIVIIAPFGRYVKKRGTRVAGIGCGTFMLLLIALGVLLSVDCVPGAAESELPMLTVAARLHPWAGYGYALLLIAAMFGAALSSQVSVVNYFAGKFPAVGRKRGLFTALVCGTSFAAGLFGFGDLIGVLYPVFGYGSILFIVTITAHYFMISGKRKKKNEG